MFFSFNEIYIYKNVSLTKINMNNGRNNAVNARIIFVLNQVTLRWLALWTVLVAHKLII